MKVLASVLMKEGSPIFQQRPHLVNQSVQASQVIFACLTTCLVMEIMYSLDILFLTWLNHYRAVIRYVEVVCVLETSRNFHEWQPAPWWGPISHCWQILVTQPWAPTWQGREVGTHHTDGRREEEHNYVDPKHKNPKLLKYWLMHFICYTSWTPKKWCPSLTCFIISIEWKLSF